jgi:hypothetical protein
MSNNGNGAENGNGRSSNGNGRAGTILWDTDPQISRIILRAMKAGATIGEAARSAGISARVIHIWIKERSHVSESIARARARGRERRLRIVNWHARRDWRAAAWMLAVENPARYSVKQRVEHSTDAKPMGEGLKDDEARDALDRLGAALDSESAKSKPSLHSRLPE